MCKYEFVLKQTYEYVLTVDITPGLATKIADGEEPSSVLMTVWREKNISDAAFNDCISNISEEVTDFDHI